LNRQIKIDVLLVTPFDKIAERLYQDGFVIALESAAVLIDDELCAL
jgi:hypothetical protein